MVRLEWFVLSVEKIVALKVVAFGEVPDVA